MSRSSGAITSGPCSTPPLQFVRDGRSGVVSIVGEAGAGKTRLADEIVERLEDEAIVIRTACAPYGETNALAPVVDGLAALLALDPDATAPTSRWRCASRSFELWGLDPTTTPCVAYLDTVTYLLGHPSRSTASMPPALATPSPAR